MAYCPKLFNCWEVFYNWSASLIHKNPDRPSPKDEASSVDEPPTVYKIGPCGGTGGQVHDIIWNSKASFLKVVVHHVAGAIDGIQVSYKWNGIHKSPKWWWGSIGWSSEFDLGEDEYLTSIRGHYGYLRDSLVVKSLTFVSNKATYGPYGEDNGSPFNLTAQGGKIVGFFTIGSYLSAIGSSINILYKETFSQMQIEKSELKSMSTALFGFTGHKVQPLGQVYKIGPCGGNGGEVKDMIANSKASILKVVVRHFAAINGIRFDLGADEYLTSIRGHYGYLRDSLVVKSLTFTSNKATYGPYGEENGSPFTLNAQGGKIVGFFARSGQYLDAIGIYTT
ncbi:agglutinin-like [Curcuma longa]|uniref:agglutinin-like n=1 Tax=Curcuma longa TaxID=136217 RepID=UPI003D9E0019